MQDHNICKLIYSNIGVKRSVGTSNLWLTLSNALKTWLKSSNMHFFLILRFPLYFFKISFVYLMSFEQSGYILPGQSVFVFPLSTTTETTFQGVFFWFSHFLEFWATLQIHYPCKLLLLGRYTILVSYYP